METYLPIKLVNGWSGALPTCWDEIEDMRRDKGIKLPAWDNMCYIPIAGTLAVVSRGKEITKNVTIGAAQLAALAPWRIYKEVYRFTPEIEAILFNQADDCVIPIEVIYNLPFQCIYVELSGTDDDLKETHGFFVHLEHDMKDERKELRFLLVGNNEGTMQLSLHLIPGGTISDGLEAFSKEAIRQGIKRGTFFDANEVQRNNAIIYKIIAKLIQLVLYICSENSEIDENSDQQKIVKRSSGIIKDKFREVRK